MSSFLHVPGTNGFSASPVQLINAADTGINALASGGKVLSAHGGALTTGIFSQTDFGSAQLARLWMTIVTAGFTPTAGGCLSGWFVISPDGGTGFESIESTASATVAALGRAPNFTINLYEGGAALAAGDIKMSDIIPLPYESFKVLIQNNSGVAFGAGAHLLTAGPVADTFA